VQAADSHPQRRWEKQPHGRVRLCATVPGDAHWPVEGAARFVEKRAAPICLSRHHLPRGMGTPGQPRTPGAMHGGRPGGTRRITIADGRCAVDADLTFALDGKKKKKGGSVSPRLPGWTKGVIRAAPSARKAWAGDEKAKAALLAREFYGHRGTAEYARSPPKTRPTARRAMGTLRELAVNTDQRGPALAGQGGTVT